MKVIILIELASEKLQSAGHVSLVYGGTAHEAGNEQHAPWVAISEQVGLNSV